MSVWRSLGPDSLSNLAGRLLMDAAHHVQTVVRDRATKEALTVPRIRQILLKPLRCIFFKC